MRRSTRCSGSFGPSSRRNKKSFAGRTGTVQGFGAGSVYPQVWLRDSATFLPATRYFYSLPFLTSWLEEHLSHQQANGALWDWIAAGDPAQFTANAPRAAQVYASGGVVLSADKNTTVADQESSAVDAAWRVYQLTSDRGWLAKPIGGRALVDRLDDALGYVAQSRVDPGFGLVASALTADWGTSAPRTRTSAPSTSTRRRPSWSASTRTRSSRARRRSWPSCRTRPRTQRAPITGARRPRRCGPRSTRSSGTSPAASTACTVWSTRAARL
jgi:hypothetical protein